MGDTPWRGGRLNGWLPYRRGLTTPMTHGTITSVEPTNMIEWEFQNEEGDSIEVEADGFDEACNLMFGEGEYDPSEWRLAYKDGAVCF